MMRTGVQALKTQLPPQQPLGRQTPISRQRSSSAVKRSGPVRASQAPRKPTAAASAASPVSESTAEQTLRLELPDGLELLATLRTNPSGVHKLSLECLPRMPLGLMLHWGVVRDGTGGAWEVLPNELRPPGTGLYKDRAMQSPFPAFGALHLVLDNEVSAIEFALKVQSRAKWYKDTARGKSNFVINLTIPSDKPQNHWIKKIGRAHV